MDHYVVAAALCEASRSIGARMCYVKSARYGGRDGRDETIGIELDAGRSVAALRRRGRVAEALECIRASDGTNAAVRAMMGISKPTLSHYISQLSAMGLVENAGTRRTQVWRLTPSGEATLARLGRLPRESSDGS